MRTTAGAKALTQRITRAREGAARPAAIVEFWKAGKDVEFRKDAQLKKLRPPCEKQHTHRPLFNKGKNENLGILFRGPAIANQKAVFPPIALHLVDMCTDNSQKRNYSREVQMPDVEITGGIVEIPLAQTGEGIADCELIRWFVKEGDMVEEFGPVCEVQSDKASVVITSRYKGKVSQILFGPGDIVKVGETLMELILEGSTAEVENRGDLQQNETRSIADSELKEGKPVEREEENAVLATPAVRMLAKNYGIDFSDIQGSGKDGRIMKHDVLNYVALKEGAKDDIQSMNEAPIHAEEPTPEPTIPEPATPESISREYPPVPPGPSSGFFDSEDTIIPVRGHRRAMARAMTAAAAVPHFHYVEEVKVDKLMTIKDTLSNRVPLETGMKLSYLPFLMKSLSTALKKYPIMNSTVDEAVTEIQVRASHNIGIAMTTSFGLVVPNVKNVQSLSVLEIATQLSRLIQLANTNSLSIDDITGGTITVSNFGTIGGKFGLPMLNVPEVAIVAIGRIHEVARPHDFSVGGVGVGNVMNVTWGADHRVIDGATVARFCNEWKLLIEEPERLLLHLQ